MCPRPASKDARLFTFKEVSQHCTPDDCYIIVDDNVYDVSSWHEKHPGGRDIILNLAGRDCSDVFRSMHPKRVYHMLPKFKVGRLQSEGKSEFARAFDALADEVYNSSGLMETNYWWYFGKTMISLFLLAVSVSLFILGREWRSVGTQLFGAFMLGVFFQQIAFLGHDTGHFCITHDRFWDTMYGVLVGPMLTGISMCWWKDSHNTHHIVPNSVQHDPDIQHLPVFAVTPAYFASLYSFYHKRVMKFDAIARVLVSYQHILFYPIMALARFNLYLQSVLFVLFNEKCEWRKVEIVSAIIFYTWMYKLHSTYCLTPAVAVGCLLLSHAVAGLLHVQICLSHFAMKIYSEPQYTQDGDHFFDTQLKTTMDVECPEWFDWFHGGLQFQAVHHLFPRVPRHNLRKLQAKVIEFCKEHNRTYHIYTFYDGNKKLLAGLKATADQVDKSGDKPVNFKESMLWEGLCAQG